MAKRIGKEINNLRKNIAKLTGDQADLREVIEPASDEEGPSIVVRMTPSTGYYKGHTIDFMVIISFVYSKFLNHT